MPRYFFHVIWPDDTYRDKQGVEFDGLKPAYWYAIGLVRRVRHEFPDAGNDWLIEIGDESGRKPLVVLPTSHSTHRSLPQAPLISASNWLRR